MHCKYKEGDFKIAIFQGRNSGISKGFNCGKKERNRLLSPNTHHEGHLHLRGTSKTTR